MTDWPALITAIATLIVALTALGAFVLNLRRTKVVEKKVEIVDGKVDEVHEEVKTGNSQTLAQLADAVETRRVKKIPSKSRTALEKSHIKDVE